MNTFGTYVCSCRDGYQQDDTECYDIDECLFDDVCRVNNGNADSYPLSSRGLMALFLCVTSDRLGKNDLQS